ncbi:protein containing DUF359, partial [mine drainage metagenome]
MQLRSDKDYKLTETSRKLIEDNNGNLATVEFIRINFQDFIIISVGDFTTEVLKSAGIIPWIEIVDLKTKRGLKSYPHVKGSIEVKNPAGWITRDLIKAIREALKSGGRTRIEVEGEEDIAVLPILFYANQNTVVIYGVPDVGMAYIMASEEVKELTSRIIDN